MRKIAPLIIILTLILICGCQKANKEPDKEGVISMTGTVRFVDLEGGFYGIVADDGNHYDPINLDKKFQVEGMRVRFEAKTRKDVATYHMWGTPIEIIKIEKMK